MFPLNMAKLENKQKNKLKKHGIIIHNYEYYFFKVSTPRLAGNVENKINLEFIELIISVDQKSISRDGSLKKNTEHIPKPTLCEQR